MTGRENNRSGGNQQQNDMPWRRPSGSRPRVYPTAAEAKAKNSNSDSPIIRGRDLKASTNSTPRGKTIDSLMLEAGVLRELKSGFSLQDIPTRLGLYDSPWNARSFAHKQPTHFSSFKLTEGLEKQLKQDGTVDFISDWENIKKLIETPLSTKSQSFIVHRMGKSILVDEFEISGSRCFEKSWEWLYANVSSVIEPCKREIVKEGKSNREVIEKEAFHKLLYFSFEQEMQVKSKNDVTITASNRELPPKLELPGIGKRTNFLHRVKWNFDKYSMLVGCNVPLYRRKSGGSSLTLRTHDSTDSEKIVPVSGLDMWLDNVLLDIPETFVAHQKDEIISSTEWVRTEDFPRQTEFDLEKVLKSGVSTLDFIKRHAMISGHTYWFYKPPGSLERKMYDLTSLSSCKESGLKIENPFTVAFATSVFRTITTLMDENKLPTLKLKEAIDLFDSKNTDHGIYVEEPVVMKLVSEMALGKLYDASNEILNSFHEPFKSMHMKVVRDRVMNDLATAFKLITESFRRLMSFNLKTIMAAVVAIKMPFFYARLKEFGIDVRDLEDGSSITLSRAYDTISSSLSAAVLLLDVNFKSQSDLDRKRIDAEIGVWPPHLYESLVWAKSSIALQHAQYFLENYPPAAAVDCPSEIDINSYNKVTKLLTEALESSNKYPNSRERRQRVAEINSLMGDAHRNQIYLITEKLYASNNVRNCTARWEPLTPDAIIHQITHSKSGKTNPLDRLGVFADDGAIVSYNMQITKLQLYGEFEFTNAFSGIEDPFECIINFLKFMDLKMLSKHFSPNSVPMFEKHSELPNFFLLLKHLKDLKQRLEDVEDLQYKNEFDVNRRKCVGKSNRWKKPHAKDYQFESAPYAVLLRIGIRLIHDVQAFLNFVGDRAEIQKMKPFISHVKELLRKSQYEDEGLRTLAENEREVLGLKKYLGIEYIIGNWNYSDFTTLLYGIIDSLEFLFKMDFLWVNLEYIGACRRSLKNPAKTTEEFDTDGRQNIGSGDSFYASSGRNTSLYSRNRNPKNDFPIQYLRSDNQTPEEWRRPLGTSTFSKSSSSRTETVGNSNASNLKSKKKKLGKKESTYIVKDNADAPYDVDKAVESITAASEKNLQNPNDTQSKKKKNKKNSRKANKGIVLFPPIAEEQGIVLEVEMEKANESSGSISSSETLVPTSEEKEKASDCCETGNADDLKDDAADGKKNNKPGFPHDIISEHCVIEMENMEMEKANENPSTSSSEIPVPMPTGKEKEKTSDFGKTGNSDDMKTTGGKENNKPGSSTDAVSEETQAPSNSREKKPLDVESRREMLKTRNKKPKNKKKKSAK